MAFLNAKVLDQGLEILSLETNRLDICSREPASYEDAALNDSMGNKIPVVIDLPSSREPSGRKVRVAAFDDGIVTSSGRPLFWALSNTINHMLLASGPLAKTERISAGNLFALDAFEIGIPDAA